MLSFMPFLRKYLCRRLKAAEMIASVRVVLLCGAAPRGLVKVKNQLPTHICSFSSKKRINIFISLMYRVSRKVNDAVVTLLDTVV